MAKDEVSAISAKPINLADIATTIATLQAARPSQRGIVIREPAPQQEQTQIEVPKGKGKKKLKRAPTSHSRDSTPSLIRRERNEVEENKLRKKAWLQNKEIEPLE